jgi:hypothetical protein
MVVWSLATAATPHTGSSVSAGPYEGKLLFRRAGLPGPGADPRVLAALRHDSDDWTWSAAVIGVRAAELQLDSGTAVMPIGGFAGRDPAPTLRAFESDVAAHRVHWYVPGVATQGPAGQIDTWARRHGRAVRVGGLVLYDLSALSRVPPSVYETR